MSRRILITGGREYGKTPHEKAVIGRVLDSLDGDETIIHGDARGADKTVGDLWESWGYPVEKHPADWDRLGKGAGFARNQEMVDAGAALCIVFPGGNGTADCRRRAEAAGIVIWDVSE